MDSFHWDKNFETGLAGIDEKHRRLVELINRFGELLGRTEDTVFLQVLAAVAELTRYAGEHFAAEESLMDQVGVDARHRSRQHGAHAGFLQEVARLRIGGAVGSMEAAEGLLRFLIHWLAYHILGTDQAMARQIAAIRAGFSPESAFDRHERLTEGPMEPVLAALDGLFRQVSESNRRLLELNRSLEAKVADRTRMLAEVNRQLEAMAMTDVLTGLPNRRHALSWLDREWGRAPEPSVPLACLMIDADGLKEVNDRHGHDAGDALLRELARSFTHRVRTDDVVCRLGGDEYLIFCPRTPPEGALMVAETLRREAAALRVPVGEGSTWSGSISVGVAARTSDMAHPDALIKAADDALYAAKERGGDCVATAPGPDGPAAGPAGWTRGRPRRANKRKS